MTEQMRSLLEQETPKAVENVETKVIGSVNQLCRSAAKTCAELGYEPVILTSSLSCTAKDAGVFLSNIAQQYTGDAKKRAFIAGGETVVHITGSGLGGRNQELALAAAENIAGMPNVCVFSVGSDGPTVRPMQPADMLTAAQSSCLRKKASASSARCKATTRTMRSTPAAALSAQVQRERT